MDNILAVHYEKLGKRVVDALNTHRFQAQYVSNKEEALAAALGMIDEGATIGMGGSVTLAEIGIKAALTERGNEIFDHQGLPAAAARIVRCKEITADVFLASSNAVTLNGELVNVDGAGNRVAALTFGPKKIIVIMGANKIVKDEAEGRLRIGMLAAPMNVDRLKKDTPCAKIGYCVDCNSPARICAVTSVMHRAPMGSDFHIIIVGESLGY